MDNLRNEKVLKEFGDHLRKLRNAKGISQRNLGLDIGSFQSTILNIEHGKHNPKLSTLHAIAEGLDISLNELMDF